MRRRISSRPRWPAATRLLVVAAVAGAACAGCGAPSHASYLKRADAICRPVNDASARLPAPGIKDVQGTGRFIESSYQLLSTENDKVARLARPKGDGKQLGSLFDQQRAALEVLRSAGVQARSGDTAGATTTFQKAAQMLAQVHQELSDYGFMDCAA